MDWALKLSVPIAILKLVKIRKITVNARVTTTPSMLDKKAARASATFEKSPKNRGAVRQTDIKV
jgi:hypothetical protein